MLIRFNEKKKDGTRSPKHVCGIRRRMSSPTARVPQWGLVADEAKEDDRAPVEAATELLAPTNGGGARVSSRTPWSSKAWRMKRKSGEDY